MNLGYVLDHLKEGELSAANLGADGEDGVNSNNVNKVIGYINMGLVSLYTRFDLKTDSCLIRYLPEVKQYELSTDFADSNTASTYTKYIMDSVDNPFVDNVLQIQKVINETLQEEFFLNDTNQDMRVVTNTYNTFTVPVLDEETVLKVSYRATPKKLRTTGRCLEDQKMDLPISHLQALCYYVAARYYGSRGGMEAMNESNNYHIKFTQECEFLSNQGVYRQDNTELTSFQKGGWV
jgi:hypothetical protein